MVIEQIISKPQMSILTSVARINLFLAGVGSGKTFLDGAISRDLISRFPEVRGFIAANTYDQLNTSTLFRIREYWESTGMTEWNKENPLGTYVSGREPPQAWTKCKRNFDRFNNIISFCNGVLYSQDRWIMLLCIPVKSLGGQYWMRQKTRRKRM